MAKSKKDQWYVIMVYNHVGKRIYDTIKFLARDVTEAILIANGIVHERHMETIIYLQDYLATPLVLDVRYVGGAQALTAVICLDNLEDHISGKV